MQHTFVQQPNTSILAPDRTDAQKKRRGSQTSNNENYPSNPPQSSPPSAPVPAIPFPLSSMKCISCGELPPQDVLQCIRGHLLCATCYARTTNSAAPVCPSCRVPLTRLEDAPRNLLVQQMLQLEVHCHNHCRGCPIGVRLCDRAAHQAVCEWQPVMCTASVYGCKWQGFRGELAGHLKSCLTCVTSQRVLEVLHPAFERQKQTFENQLRQLQDQLDVSSAENDRLKLMIDQLKQQPAPQPTPAPQDRQPLPRTTRKKQKNQAPPVKAETKHFEKSFELDPAAHMIFVAFERDWYVHSERLYGNTLALKVQACTRKNWPTVAPPLSVELICAAQTQPSFAIAKNKGCEHQITYQPASTTDTSKGDWVIPITFRMKEVPV